MLNYMLNFKKKNLGNVEPYNSKVVTIQMCTEILLCLSFPTDWLCLVLSLEDQKSRPASGAMP